MSLNKGAQIHFDKIPEQWDALYSHENPWWYRLNKLLRPALFSRYQLTFEQCDNITNKTVLDIGCGTGRYSIEFAKRGAKRVVGIDFSPSMIEFCKKMAQEAGVAERCEFLCSEFLAMPLVEEKFDYIVAMGFFDYIENAQPFFDKIASLQPTKFIASFPLFSFLWGIQRHIRYYWIKKCPIYYYNKEQIESLCHNAGFPSYQVLEKREGLFCIAE
jgi:cyclopropane fatty-acyl-phospholipid synthase-like methyltransferase